MELSSTNAQHVGFKGCIRAVIAQPVALLYNMLVDLQPFVRRQLFFGQGFLGACKEVLLAEVFLAQ